MKLTAAISRTGFDVLKKREDILNIEHEMTNPGFWENRDHARERSQELALLKRDSERWDRVTSELKTLEEFCQIMKDDDPMVQDIAGRVAVLEKEFRALQTELFFSGKYDKGSAVVSFYAGAGGKDAEDWAAMLKRMFERFAEKKKWKVKTIHEHFGENQGSSGWGIKNASIAVEGLQAYGYLKKEGGVHRLVRISPFSAQQLRHTSFALVEVMPELVMPEEVEINPEELKTDFFRSSGPGGQNVNKRETAVRITHVPTGMHAAAQSERTQERNRDIAMQMLRAKLYQKKVELQKKETGVLRGELATNEWGSQIRSYVLHPYKLVKDHRTGFETTQVEKVLDGELDGFIEAELKGFV